MDDSHEPVLHVEVREVKSVTLVIREAEKRAPMRAKRTEIIPIGPVVSCCLPKRSR